METYHGHIRTPADAIKLFEACRLGVLPRVQRRLSEKERQLIKSGSVFVWDEREAGMRRWTDGKSWSASRVSGSFLTYREMEGKRGGGQFIPPPPRHVAGSSPESSRGSDEDMDEDEPDGYRYKMDGLMKQSFSITTSIGQHLHLISYYSRPHPNDPELPQPTSDLQLRHIIPVKGMYPESTLHETQGLSTSRSVTQSISHSQQSPSQRLGSSVSPSDLRCSLPYQHPSSLAYSWPLSPQPAVSTYTEYPSVVYTTASSSRPNPSQSQLNRSSPCESRVNSDSNHTQVSENFDRYSPKHSQQPSHHSILNSLITPTQQVAIHQKNSLPSILSNTAQCAVRVDLATEPTKCTHSSQHISAILSPAPALDLMQMKDRKFRNKNLSTLSSTKAHPSYQIGMNNPRNSKSERHVKNASKINSHLASNIPSIGSLVLATEFMSSCKQTNSKETVSSSSQSLTESTTFW
ncbi:unnamed protein product [Blumeria hordei]|uniref:cAMP-independent regulatory protein pac2 n=1 Tax=Blumeria hordei TaxID=2867405 RepID=A0A383USK4_BLUHO|nr:unnamed protein product [Blumeria hordei]